MYYQRKNLRICCRHAIKHHNAYDNIVPWASSVRCWNDNGNTAAHKEQQGGRQRKAAAETEAKETEIELHEIAEPYTNSLNDKQPTIFHSPQREQPLDKARYERPYPFPD